jgi:hypothetical protein
LSFRSSVVATALSALGATLGCGSSDTTPADVSGTYAVNITNDASTCSFDWNQGEMNTNIPIVITQDGKNATADVQGLAAVALALRLGTAQFKGTVSGNSVNLVAYGTTALHDGNCTYTLNGTIAATLSGDTLTGTVTYAPATNGNPDCASVKCAAVQRFNGSRPPR